MTTKSIALPTAATLLLLIGLVLLPFGCKDEEETAPDTSVDQYLTALPNWDEYCPQLKDEELEGEAGQEIDCNTKYVITTTPCSITRTPEDIVTYDQASEIIYLGSLIQGDGYMQGPGSIQQLPIYQRAPLSITISFSTADNTRVVDNPSLTTVNQAIGELVEAAQDAGHVSGSSIFFRQVTTHSVEHTALALGLSARYMSAKVKSDLAWEQTTETTTISAYFIQKMFTTSMELPQRPLDLFSSDFTKEILDEQVSLGRIGPGNLPVYVSNIVWGQMMLLTMTSTFDETRMKAALSASYAGIGGSVSAEHLETLQQSEIQLVTVGGDAENALSLLKSGNLGGFFNSVAPLTTAVPISYTLRSLSDNKVAKVSEITDYDRVEFAPLSVTHYNNESDWRNASLGAGLELKEWAWNFSTAYLATESGGFISGSSGQVAMGTHVTYLQGATGFPFDFYLENTAVEGNIWGLVLNDQEGFPSWTVSIGDIDDFEDDDFEVGVSGTAVYALGIELIENAAATGEYFETYGTDGQQVCYIGQISENLTGYLGIISPVPLSRLWFNEDTGADDMAVGKFTFGVKEE